MRHGTTTLFAALEIATGQITGLCKNRHRHQEILAFLKHVSRAYPDQQLHLVMDNYAAHKRGEIRDWLAANPRIQVHFTPTSVSWLTLVEVWFGSSNARPSFAAPSAPSATSTPRSATSSPAGTVASIPSSEPRRQTNPRQDRT